MEYHERLIKVMKDAGVKNKDLIKPCGVTNGAISQWRRGDFKPKNLVCIAQTCGWDTQDLQRYLEDGIEPILGVKERHGDYEVEVLHITEKVPLIDMVAAGNWMETINPYEIGDAESWEACPVKHGKNTFAVRINGESMSPKFAHGEVIFCDPSQHPENKDFVIAKLTDENQTTFKQLVIDDGKMMLKALNPNWPTPYIPINGNCEIVGKVIARLETF